MASHRNSQYLPLEVNAFLSDEKLSECSAAATGVYIRLLCLMHKSEDYGKIKVVWVDTDRNDLLADCVDKLSKHMPYRWQEIYDCLMELLTMGVLYFDNNYLCQKRMVRDGQISAKRSASGKLGMAHRYGKEGQEMEPEEPKVENVTEKMTEPAQESESDNGSLFAPGEVETVPAPTPPPKKVATTHPPKVQYAEAVRMKEVEYNTLISDYGPELTQKFIDKLNNYKLAYHKKYAEDYRAILNWVVGEVMKQENSNHGQNNNNRAGPGEGKGAGPRDYDTEM